MNFYPLSMNNIFEAEKFELEQKLENTINEIKIIILKVLPPLT